MPCRGMPSGLSLSRFEIARYVKSQGARRAPVEKASNLSSYIKLDIMMCVHTFVD